MIKNAFTSFCCVAILFAVSFGVGGCAAHPSASSVMVQGPTQTSGFANPFIKQPGSGAAWKILTDRFAGGGDLLGIAASPPDKLWVADGFNTSIDEFDIVTGAITAFKLPAPATMYGVTLGPDGRIWFPEVKGTNLDAIATMSPHQINQYPTVLNGTQYFPEDGVTVGPDGNMWFAADKGYVGVMSTSGTMIGDYQLIPNGCGGARITVGPDQNLWVTSFNCPVIDRVTPTGTVTAFTIPNNDMAWDILPGPDGNLYFTELGGAYKLGKISGGIVTELTSPYFIYQSTGAVFVGNDLWLVAEVGPGYDEIGRFDVTTQKFLSPLVPPPGIKQTTRTNLFAIGGDGNVYFTNTNGDIGVRILLAMTIVPTKATIAPAGTQTITVTEKNYSGGWTAVSNKPNIATVAPGNTNNTFVVTGQSAGTADIKISDSTGNYAFCVVTVT